MAWLRQSLARGTASLVVAISLVATLLMTIAATSVLDGFARRTVEARLEDEVAHLEDTLSAWHEEEAEDIDRAAKDGLLLAALARGPAGDAAALERLASLLAAEPEGLGIAVVHGPGQPTLSVSPWLPENWPTLADRPPKGRSGINSALIGGTRVDLIGVPIASARGGGALWLAANPELAFDHLTHLREAKLAVLDERGELIAGAQHESFVARDGFSELSEANGAVTLALDRKLGAAPWRVVATEPLVGAPTAMIWNVVLVNLLIALIAGGIAFWTGIWRLRTLNHLADGARRLAAGDFGVRVHVHDAEDEVQTLARSFNEMAEQLQTQRLSLEDRHQELLRANEVLEQLSITDGLTHLHNHRHFHDQFARETKRADRSGAPLCLLLIDLDDFKALNDRHGHAAGDFVLSVAAGLMNSQVRESDYLARYGGEEFAMLLPQTAIEGALALAEKVRAVLSTHAFVLLDTEESLHVTVSIGVAQHFTSSDETFDAADRALYDAKASGKDCVVVAPQRSVDASSL
jgi:diguanylate cyclase (GGDEF)-like protein